MTSIDELRSCPSSGGLKVVSTTQPLRFKTRLQTRRKRTQAKPVKVPTHTFYEFFAGGGMARMGLGERWKCVFANDVCAKKAAAYFENFECNGEYTLKDVAKLEANQLPGHADLAWASFPCQDLSLAGQGAGLSGGRSGTFWSFWNLIKQVNDEKRAPKIVVLENVLGALSSHEGKDFQAIMQALRDEGYKAGCLVGDAIHFIPQSRQRLFIIAVKNEVDLPAGLSHDGPCSIWHPPVIKRTFASLPKDLKTSWVWWNLPVPPEREISIEEIIEDAPSGVKTHSRKETDKILSMMSKTNFAKVKTARKSGKTTFGCVYKRTRKHNGQKVQRAEVRFDGVSGCLRTPAGGSSRQIILIVDGEETNSRLLSPREAARLMGVPDTYKLPKNYNEAYHLMGDGLAVPVVAWIETHLLHPLLAISSKSI
jgi:DNA (cytosine-5)-methyltransferase 1